MWAALTVSHWINGKVGSFDLFASLLFAIEKFIFFVGVVLLGRLFGWRCSLLVRLFCVGFGHCIRNIHRFYLRLDRSRARFCLSSVWDWTLLSWSHWWRFHALVEAIRNSIGRPIGWSWSQINFFWRPILAYLIETILLTTKCFFARARCKQCFLWLDQSHCLLRSLVPLCLVTLVLCLVELILFLVFIIRQLLVAVIIRQLLIVIIRQLLIVIIRLLLVLFLLLFGNRLIFSILVCLVNFSILVFQIGVGLSYGFRKFCCLFLVFWVFL